MLCVPSELRRTSSLYVVAHEKDVAFIKPIEIRPIWMEWGFTAPVNFRIWYTVILKGMFGSFRSFINIGVVSALRHCIVYKICMNAVYWILVLHVAKCEKQPFTYRHFCPIIKILFTDFFSLFFSLCFFSFILYRSALFLWNLSSEFNLNIICSVFKPRTTVSFRSREPFKNKVALWKMRERRKNKKVWDCRCNEKTIVNQILR
jgi:hypothetical protein